MAKAMDTNLRERQAMHEVTNRLTQTFGTVYSPEVVTRTVTTIHHRFDDKPIRDFVPVLVERFAREELRAPADG
jgi:translation initiation factor 2 alpha subunit (eIF-2alpha)